MMLNIKYIPAYVGNYTKDRAAQGGKISEITIHHCAGIMSIEDLGRLWQRKGRNGSSHYGVSGRFIGQYVKEEDVAWTNSNWKANCRAVTIETSNSGGAPNWPVSAESIDTLVHLVADIAERNDLFPLVLGKNLTWHSMYTATACPGPYLKSKLREICDKANALHTTFPPLSELSVKMDIGPASAGDRLAISRQAEALGVACVEDDNILVVGEATAEAQSVILALASSLGLPYKLHEESGCEELVAALKAERDKEHDRAERAITEAARYLKKLEAVRKALEE